MRKNTGVNISGAGYNKPYPVPHCRVLPPAKF